MKICENCRHSLFIHPLKRRDYAFLMRCTKYNKIVADSDTHDCWEHFIGWAYREKVM